MSDGQVYLSDDYQFHVALFLIVVLSFPVKGTMSFSSD